MSLNSPRSAPPAAYFCGECVEDMGGVVVSGTFIHDRPLAAIDERCNWCGGPPSREEVDSLIGRRRALADLAIAEASVQAIRSSKPTVAATKADAKAPGGERGERHREYLSVAEFADELAVSVKTVRRWITVGEVTAVYAGRSVRIRRSELGRVGKSRPGVEPDAGEIAERILSGRRS